MPAFDVALVELGHLLGFFQPDGQVDWRWFGDPKARAFASLPAERERIGALIRALLDRGAPTGAFSPAANWEPIIDTNNVGLGITWSSSNTPAAAPLQLGVGAKANLPIGGQPISLAALARLVEIAGTNVTPKLGDASFAGTFPVPSFLSAGALTGEVAPGAVSVGLAATNRLAQTRQLDYPNPVIAWDAARLAVFVLKAWIQERANANDAFFQRVNNHIFPMMGDPAGVIAAFPLVAPMHAAPDFTAWRSSVLTTDNNASGALTFLWHLKALLTGNDDPNFLTGSFFFPISGAPQVGGPPTLADAIGNYARPTGTTGAWIGLLTEPAGTFTLVLDLETVGPNHQCRIPLGRWDGAQLTRPDLDNSWHDLVDFVSAGAGLPIGNELITAAADGQAFTLSLIRTTVGGSGFAGFDGNYDISIRLEANTPPRFVLGTPALHIDFPPDGNDAEQLLGDIVVWALKAAAPTNDLGQLIAATGDFLKETVTGGNPDEIGLLTKVVGVAAQGQQVEVSLGSGVSLDLGVANGKVEAGVEIGPIENDTLSIYVERLKGSVILNPSAAPHLDGFSLGFENLRLSNEGAGSGIVASLIPDMRQFPGFNLAVTYASQKLTVTGGGKIPIQRTIGPLEIAALLVDIREQSFAVGLDLGFKLAAISVAAYELGIRFHFDDGSIEPFLHGLGLSMDTPAVKLAGFFAAVDTNGVIDYVGGATVSIAGYFELSAIGGYTQVAGDASLFIFASLVAPLGGPPWFFITGVAGGFGYNRSLPAPGLMLDHPFLKVMRGEIAVSGNAATALKELSVHFVAMKGQHWIAAGIQFIAFGFIYGKVVIAIAFGKHFSISILGMASFGIEPIAYFEIGIEATADEEKFMLRARLSPNSYVIHPDIFSLQGDFALCAWYRQPHKGDFLFSIGGYHPLFQKPAHYPELIRVGCKAIVYNFVHLSVEVFFACTPQALMAGAKASLWAEFAGIAAGLDVYIDVLMKWDPFFLRARLGVHVWFEFFGRHEIGVDLEIWTPDFGGVATIDLVLVEFDIEFGAGLLQPPPPPLFEFVTRQLSVPAKSWNGGARTAAFNTDAGAGLFRVDILTGRPGKEPPPQDERQEGLDPAAPLRLSPEWSFVVRTRLPIGGIDTQAVPAPAPTFSGLVDLPLCGPGWLDRPSTLTVSAPRIAAPTVARSWVGDYFPAATFGEPVPEAQMSARDTISKLKTDTPSIPLIEGMIVAYGPSLPAAPALTAPLGEPSDPDESYPVPLGSGGGGLFGAIKVPFAFGAAANLAVTHSGGLDRRASAIADMRGRRRAPFSVLLRTAELQRVSRLTAGQALRAPTAATSALPAMSPPASPARPPEMFGVQLRVLPVRSNEPVPRRFMETISRPRLFKESLLSDRQGVRDIRTTVTVPAGRASQLEIGGGGISGGELRLTGDQTVRTLLFDRSGAIVRDGYVRGSTTVKLPRTVTRAVLLGEGLVAGPSTAGVERDSVLLATASRQFIGHGCVLDVTSTLDLNVRALDSLPGADIFDRASTVRVSFTNSVPREGAFVLRLVPTVDAPGPATEQVRWLGTGAQFRGLVPVVAAGRVALVMSVVAPAAWSVEIDLGHEWRLDGVVCMSASPRQVVADLQRDANWDLVDDAMPVHSARLSTSVSLEAKG